MNLGWQTETDLDLADSEREAALERITERNIVLLLEDIVQRCQGIFIPASTAVVRRIEADTTPLINALSSSVVVPTAAETQLAPCVSRERLVVKVRAILLLDAAIVRVSMQPRCESSRESIDLDLHYRYVCRCYMGIG